MNPDRVQYVLVVVAFLCQLERLPDLRGNVRPRRRERPQERDERVLIGGDAVSASVRPNDKEEQEWYNLIEILSDSECYIFKT